MTFCQHLSRALKILYPTVHHVELVSGHANLRHAHFHLIPSASEVHSVIGEVPVFEA